MINIPEKIYLQIGDECDSEDFNELSEVSWCKDKIYENDIEFVLKEKTDNNSLKKQYEFEKEIQDAMKEFDEEKKIKVAKAWQDISKMIFD